MSGVGRILYSVVPAVVLAGLSLPSLARDDGTTGALAPRPDPQHDFKNYSYYGTVTAVTRDSITIDGKDHGTKPTLSGNRRFEASPPLARGRSGSDYAMSYRLSDVRVGDRVRIKFDRVHSVDVCTAICIERRPGGVVPPTPQAGDSRHLPPWHELANARQQFEEKGTPIPKRLQPPTREYFQKLEEWRRGIDEREAQMEREKRRRAEAGLPPVTLEEYFAFVFPAQAPKSK